jgi:chromosome segregation ATPase
MTSLEEIIELEQQIDELTRDISTKRLKLSQCEDNITRVAAVLEAAIGRVTLHRGNRHHMRAVADLVDIKEWSTTQKHLSSALEAKAQGEVDLSVCTQGRVQLRGDIAALDTKLAEIRRRRKTYGKLEQFRPKKSP